MKKKIALIFASLILGIFILSNPIVANSGTIPQKVLAFYYGWWGDANQDWKHWESPNPIGITTEYTPTLGFYSSLDRGVIEQQVAWAKSAGIDGFIFSWWQLEDELDHFNTGLQALLDVAEEKDFLVSVYIETEDEATVAEQIQYLINQGYTNSSAWYHKDGRPVFYLWYGVTVDHVGNENKYQDYWFQTKQQISIPVYLNAHKFSYAYPYGIDATHEYVYFDDNLNEDGYVADFLWNVGAINEGDYSLTVNPGYMDDILRRNGQRYRDQWESALNIQANPEYPGYQPDEILITSWNEYHESSIVEPTEDFGTLYLNITAEYAGGEVSHEEVPGEDIPDNECVDGEIQDCDTGQSGACAIGILFCENGSWGGCIRVHNPTREVCDGIDNDCDGQVDEGCRRGRRWKR